jgi:hypothetical protein
LPIGDVAGPSRDDPLPVTLIALTGNGFRRLRAGWRLSRDVRLIADADNGGLARSAETSTLLDIAVTINTTLICVIGVTE